MSYYFRLGTYIDVLQIHRLDRTVPMEETMKALHDVVQSGKVQYIGGRSKNSGGEDENTGLRS